MNVIIAQDAVTVECDSCGRRAENAQCGNHFDDLKQLAYNEGFEDGKKAGLKEAKDDRAGDGPDD